MGKIDLKRWRRSTQQIRINCRPDELLPELGMECSVSRGELYALCPNPEHHDQHVGTWSMCCDPGSDMNGISYCFMCGWSGDIFSVIQILTGCDFPQAIDLVRGVHVDLADDHPADIIYSNEIYDSEMQPWLPKEVERPADLGPITEGSACWRYLHDRRFGVDEIRYYGLGDLREEMRLFVPVMFGGKLIGYAARSYVDAPKKIKFLPYGSDSGTWGLIGLDRADRSVTMVSLADGWADSFRLRRAGLKNPIATCGSTLSEEQAWMLSWVERVDVWADGDAGGERLIQDVVGWLGPGRDIRVAMMAPGTDPDDKSEEQLQSIEPVAFRDYRKRRRQNDGGEKG